MSANRFIRLAPAIENVALVYLMLFVVAYVFVGTTVIDGNIHDFFLPINAAYAKQLGGIGQDTLRSPFGPLYAVLAANSLALIEMWPGWIQLDKIHALSSLQFMIFPVILFFAYRALQENDRKFPKWLLIVSLTVCVLPRSADQVLTIGPHWYGTYNNHLWSILLLQAANAHAWRGRQPDARRLRLIGLTDAICIAVSFHYKISFFVPALLLVLFSAACVGGWKQRFSYLAVIAAVTCGAAVLFSAAGYSYPAYFRELQWALAAKSLPLSALLTHVFLAAVFVAVFDVIRQGGTSGNARPADALTVSLDSLKYISNRLGFSMATGSAILLAALGDFQTPVWPYIVLLALAFSADGNRSMASVPVYPFQPVSIGFHASVWVFVIVVTGFVSLACLIRPQLLYGGQPLERLHVRSIAAGPLRFEYVPWNNYASPGELVEAGLSAGPPTPDQLIRMSYNLAATIRTGPQNESLKRMADAQYPAGLGATAQSLIRRTAALSPGAKVVIGHVGFANPWPFLTGNLFPHRSLHWMHLHTTIGDGQIYPALEPMATADAVVVPAMHLPPSEQNILNCFFYRWNMRKGEIFVLQEISGLNLVFLRKGGRLQPDPNPPFRLDYREIDRVCAK